MSGAGASQGNQDLLARLNALKKTHIDLDDKQYKVPITAQLRSAQLDPAPALALHSDLLSRFKSLAGNNPSFNTAASGHAVEGSVSDTDGKTVEEILADLGSNDQWNINNDEEAQIGELLISAKTALDESNTVPAPHDAETGGPEGEMRDPTSRDHELPNIDLEVYQPQDAGDSSDDDRSAQPRKSKQELEAEIDTEADAIVAKIRDELKNAPQEPETSSIDQDPPMQSKDDPSSDEESQDLEPSDPASLFPIAPSQGPVPPAAPTDDLASRFASLSLPSVPSTINPPSKSAESKQAAAPGYTDEEIDSWCIICTDDANLTCKGCEGDLFCTKCWLETHRGEDAGFDERTHRAVVYNKGGGVKKERRKVGVAG